MCLGRCKSFWLWESPEHFGWLLCYVYSAMISSYTLSVTSPGLLELSRKLQDRDGKVVFGMRWDNVVATSVTIGGLCMLFIGPFFGSLADYTDHRKLFGTVAMVATTACVTPWLFVSEGMDLALLGVIYVFGIVQLVSYLSVYLFLRAPYLPELATAGAEVNRLSGKGYIIMFSSQVCFLGVLTAASNMGGDDLYLSMVYPTLTVLVFGGVVTALAIPRIGTRKASNKLKPGENLRSIGFVSVWNSFKVMNRKYTQLQRFVYFVAFANAAFNAAPALATTYMVSLKRSKNEIVGALGAALVFGIVGPVLFSFLQTYKVHAKQIMIGTLLFYLVSIILFPIIAPLGFGYIFLGGTMIGVSSGLWLAAGQAFFASLCPGGLETTFTGVYMFANKSLDWMPPLIFVIVNEATGSMQTALYSAIVIFVLVSIAICSSIQLDLAEKEISGTLHKRRITLSPTETKAMEMVKIKKLKEEEKAGKPGGGMEPRNLSKEFKREEAGTESHTIDVKEADEQDGRSDGKIIPVDVPQAAKSPEKDEARDPATI